MSISMNIADVWSNLLTGLDSNPHYLRIDIFVSHIRRVFSLDGSNFVEYDEGTELFNSIVLPLTFFNVTHDLQIIIDSSLDGLNESNVYMKDFCQGILSFFSEEVGGYLQEFYLCVYLEAVQEDIAEYLETMEDEVAWGPMEMEEEPPGGVPASSISVQKLREKSFPAPQGTANSLGTCAICLEDLAVNNGGDGGNGVQKGKIIEMPCSHLFHDPCIVTWLERSRQCPLCRQEVSD
ncbi:hypothetical protein SAY86_026167 [Trapa natans]|uniref:RING-type domain-containing protein n=1 Tax=Trapa natans TaxID=22666 RepID=A0AAN7QEB2_TRANT|nr:hypothetical protein SAY86_026167 [Trapa natans]